jgi:hypothetical protein
VSGGDARPPSPEELGNVRVGAYVALLERKVAALKEAVRVRDDLLRECRDSLDEVSHVAARALDLSHGDVLGRIGLVLDAAASTELEIVCSFCGKSRADVETLVAGRRSIHFGDTVYICDECIGLCGDIVAERVTDNESIDVVREEADRLGDESKVRLCDEALAGSLSARKAVAAFIRERDGKERG